MKGELRAIPKDIRDKVLGIINGALDGGTQESILVDQLKNYGKKSGARWNSISIPHCIILQARAPGAYEFMRKSGMFHLPTKDTLRAYTGRSTLESGVSPLVIKRLQIEFAKLKDIETHGSLILDEMTVAPSETYIANLQKFCGPVDMAGVIDAEDPNRLANRMLGFIFQGLSTNYKIPVAYFLVNQLTAEELKALTVHVIEEVEKTGFKVDRLVTDNLSVNVSLFALLNDNVHHPVVCHPVQPHKKTELIPSVMRPLFLSFDYCHVTKNVRSQFFERNFHINGKEVSGKYAKLIYEMQQKELLRPVRNWTKKHVAPNSIEKQKVKPAMDLFRPEVTAAILMHAEKKKKGFEDVQATVAFMKKMHRWISFHDISSSKEHLRKRLKEKKPISKLTDPRLTYFDFNFRNELRKWKEEIDDLIAAIPPGEKEKRKKEKLKFLTKETYFAIQFTTKSTVECIRYLLEDVKFEFVLTRRFSSDSIEQLFGAIRQMTGGNFKGDATAVSQAFEKILRTGIAYSSINGNTRLEREQERQYKMIRNPRQIKNTRKE